MMQGELKFFSNYPSKDTLRLLLEWQSLYSAVQTEKKRMTLIPPSEAMRLLDIPSRKLSQYVKEGYLKQKTTGEIYKYQVINLLFEVKQQELYLSIS